jgi:hypothetical protein
VAASNRIAARRLSSVPTGWSSSVIVILWTDYDRLIGHAYDMVDPARL